MFKNNWGLEEYIFAFMGIVLALAGSKISLPAAAKVRSLVSTAGLTHIAGEKVDDEKKVAVDNPPKGNPTELRVSKVKASYSELKRSAEIKRYGDDEEEDDD